MRIRHVLPHFSVLTAVACRIWALEMMPLSYDRGYPLGLGIFIRDAIAAGRFDDLPWMSLLASINLRNPAGASWFWAVISTIDASPFVATVLVALLHAVIVTAVTHRIAAQLFGEPVGIAAGLLAACSPWAAWVARGPWLQGTLEVFAALSAWLLFCGLHENRPRRTFAGLLVIAGALHTYLAAFGLLAQTGIALLASLRTFTPSHANFTAARKALALGTLTVVLSLAWIAGAFLAARGDVRAAVDNPNAINADLKPGELNLDPIRHALRLTSGRDFENTFGDTTHPDWRDWFGDAQSMLLDLAILLGVLLTAAHARTDARMRFVLLWFVTPIALTFVIGNFIMREWKVHVFYLTLASPMMYVLAAAPLQLLRMQTLRTFTAALVLIVHLASALANQASDIAVRHKDPVGVRASEGIATGAATRLGRILAARCASVLSAENEVWLASWIGSSRLTRPGALRADNTSGMALVEPAGHTCLVQNTPDAPLPYIFDREPIIASRAPDAPPVIELEAVPQEHVLYTVNLGWSLLQLDAPAQAYPGEDVVIRHVWRIDALPPEEHAAWYFAPFIDLRTSDGAQVATFDHARALLGYAWRPGSQLHSIVHFKIPASTAPGRYTLEFSLFDPNQKKNAVYFDPRDPATPVVVLKQTIIVK